MATSIARPCGEAHMCYTVRGPVANHKEACWACESEDDWGLALLGLVGTRAAGAH